MVQLGHLFEMCYSYVRLGGRDLCFFRLFGPGLGNLLLPWARFIVATRRYGLTPLAPAWPQFKLGPLWRRERDNRLYVGLFKTPANQIGGLKKLLLLARSRCISEDYFNEMVSKEKLDPSSVVVFDGLGDYFIPILNEHDYVFRTLVSITRDEHKAAMAYDFGISISVHIRLTDFQPTTDKPRLEPMGNTRLPVSWYQHIINEIRSAAGAHIPVNVFSDGKDEELALLLAMPGVKRLTFGSSIADLLAMSRSRVLITSGSTFSRWASYLGRMPVVWYPRLLDQRLYYERPFAEIECGQNEHLPRVFCNAIEL